MKQWSVLAVLAFIAAPACGAPVSGPAPYADWRSDAPGVVHKITLADLPAANATPGAVAPSSLAPRPEGADPKVPPGFTVTAFAKLEGPREVKVAPNGDIFVAESEGGRIRVLRAADGAAAAADTQTFAEGLDRPYGIAFYPAGPNPQWVYVANTSSVVRYPYQNGDMKARAAAEVVVPALPHGGGHWTRDLAFSPDGHIMYVAVGSASNVAEEISKKNPSDTAAWQAAHAPGAAWDKEEDRADVLAFDPQGGGRRVFASGIRNCAGIAVSPQTGRVWCATNERDMIGDNLPPDYVTQVTPGAFYGWPWYYIGGHEDPRRAGERPDLAGKVSLPDVLLQPHSAPLQLTFYQASSGASVFPAAYRGQAFMTLHGSWNRAKRTGYKVVVVRLKDGVPTGDYQDFLTGFVVDDSKVWGRPVGVAVAHDGALLVTDDGGGILWRVAHAGQ